MGGVFFGLIEILFYLLFFFVPLILFPKTSELFEFNKMVLTYAFTILIVFSWIIKMVLTKKIIFRRTFLDIPLILFLAFQFFSFLVSIDHRTSLLGYYSRFHGGLLSTISYLLLYWAYVANMDRGKVIKSLYFLLASAVLVSIYGVLEHFGIDKGIWVQDVQNRVFSTLGQPNWLAAWITALTPLTWGFALNEQLTIYNLQLTFRNKRFWLWIGLSALFFLTLLYTKSRSGLLGLAVADFIFWSGTFWIQIHKEKNEKRKLIKKFVICHLSLLILIIISGTPWTPSLKNILIPKPTVTTPTVGPALETGGTESGEIRRIVWKGAIDIWRHYPILGSGVETFAFAYYRFRPLEHNLTSEWDYLYNKAHNEYLNYLATTGIVGLASYLFLIATISFTFLKNFQFSISNLQTNPKVILALASGWASILVTNFFGFSVVPVALLFFLYPAMAVTLVTSDKTQAISHQKKATFQKLAIGFLLLVTCYWLFVAFRYWYSDFLYAKGKLENDAENFVAARKVLTDAAQLSPHEAIFWDELAQADTAIAVALQENGDAEGAAKLADSAEKESAMAVFLSPANVNLKRSRASMFVKLSSLNPTNLIKAKEELEKAITLAPTDAKLFYNLALAYIRVDERDTAIETLIKITRMKPNYREARYALALLYIDDNQPAKAKEELQYILTKINPQDVEAKKELDGLAK